jgi:hemin uptake protein HemP
MAGAFGASRPARRPARIPRTIQMNTYNPRVFLNRTHPVETQPRPEYKRMLVRTLTSQSLFQGEHEIGIEHHGALYRLKITRQGKLILNK